MSALARMTLSIIRGSMDLSGPAVDVIASKALDTLHDLPKFLSTPSSYSITVISEQELRCLSQSQLARLPTQIDPEKVHALGVGGDPAAGILFVVVIWAPGQQLRKSLGLPPRSFFIPLSSDDREEEDHGDIDNKGIDSLLPGQFPAVDPAPSPDLLDHIAFTLHLSGRYQQQIPFCLDLVAALPKSHRGFLRLADAAKCAGRYKLAMLSYASAFQRASDDKVRDYCVKKAVECSPYTEWGALFLESESSQLPRAIEPVLLEPWSEDLRSVISDKNVIPSLCLDSAERLHLPSTCSSSTTDRVHRKLPRNFRWIVPFCIAIMSTPRDENDVAALASPHMGIRHVLTLTEEEPLNSDWFKKHPITNTYLPVTNFHAPSIEQMDIIVTLVQDDRNLPLLVHCGGGKGRAGTVVACYLAAYGFQRPRMDQTHPAMTPGDAIAALRRIRPGSIETSQQEQFVSRWCKAIWSRGSVLPDVPSEPPPCPLQIEGDLTKDSDLFVLVGLPGAGKSWFSNALRARSPKAWTRISQDESGSRSQCEAAIGRAQGRILLDRCNTDPNDRKTWLTLASVWARAPVCVWFDYDSELCTSRAQRRIGHPTLVPGSRVRNAIAQMRKNFVRPNLDEGFKAIVTVRSFAAAQDLVHRLSPPVLLFKYPRTPHFLDLGATSADDIVINLPTLSDKNVVITEKVDGSNMGFSLSSDRQKILVQNRSHFVNSATHEQFKKLDLWVERHREDLFRVLDRDEHFPERYILFGEWMYATHSIPYTHLPDTFLAFDLYDRRDEVWASRKTVSTMLSGTRISLVPVMHEGSMPCAEELKSMIQSPSLFYDGRVEGIYIKEEKNGIVTNRGKVVRGDFICGNEHWTRGNLRVNGMLRGEAGTQ